MLLHKIFGNSLNPNRLNTILEQIDVFYNGKAVVLFTGLIIKVLWVLPI
ncbi:hypothetical protein GIHI108528_09285 [Gillisia hiemivivida]